MPRVTEHLFGRRRRTYVWEDGEPLRQSEDGPKGRRRRHALAGFFVVLSRMFSSVFLPTGYPGCVSPEYISFQAWDTIQAMCSYLRGILATRALLEGIGVGDEAATPMAATVQWVLRDGASMLGGLVFVWWGGSRFDVDVKRWRLFADVINDVGLTLEMFAPLAGEWFLVVACIGSVCKALCGVAAGSTRAALTAHFALKDNLADVAAKEGSQETAVTLMGLIAGLLFARTVNHSPTAIWTAFVLLTALHVVANYKAVRCLNLRVLNRNRLAAAWRLHTSGQHGTVESINATEPIVPRLNELVQRVRIRMGVRLSEVAGGESFDSLVAGGARKYVIAARPRKSLAPGGALDVNVAFGEGAEAAWHVEAFVHALEFRAIVTARGAPTSASGLREAMQAAHRAVHDKAAMARRGGSSAGSGSGSSDAPAVAGLLQQFCSVPPSLTGAGEGGEGAPDVGAHADKSSTELRFRGDRFALSVGGWRFRVD